MSLHYAILKYVGVVMQCFTKFELEKICRFDDSVLLFRKTFYSMEHNADGIFDKASRILLTIPF